ncbi:50S ribosomal protein L28 [Candidatus Aerophobetes bacterium]|uniref:Large ribosomal subunit protein bL28 n=1 Tax=Aerophobetes bacterium TaxID=2030807 RepID=A0A523YKZ5_UNCAE|nr:MAG: 50S ribosomal protein L28 [Candidatus Aerophobetes bacterium]
MAKKCAICGKGPNTGNRVSKSGRRTKRRWLPNLQHIRIKAAGRTKRAYVCTRCIRSHRVEKIA